MKILSAAFFFLTLTFQSVEAHVSDDIRSYLSDGLRDADVQVLQVNDKISVIGASVQNDLYSKPIFLEIEVELAGDIEMYLVNESHEEQRNNRNTKVFFLQDMNDSGWTKGYSKGWTPIAVYPGQTKENKSRFAILSPGMSLNTFISIYVKNAGRQVAIKFYIRS